MWLVRCVGPIFLVRGIWARGRVEWGCSVPRGLNSGSCDVGVGPVGLKLGFGLGWLEIGSLGLSDSYLMWLGLCFAEEVRGFLFWFCRLALVRCGYELVEVKAVIDKQDVICLYIYFYIGVIVVCPVPLVLEGHDL